MINEKEKNNNSLIITHPQLVEEWDYAKNKKISPEEFLSSSNRIVWWKCSEGHEWEATINSRAKGSSCPYCKKINLNKDNNVSILFPELVKEWHPTKNKFLTPEMFSASSTKRVWWVCEHNHVWDSTISNRTKTGRGCPHCKKIQDNKGKSLFDLFPELVQEWDPIKNGFLTPDMYTASSTKRVWWKCEHGHKWDCTIVNRTKNDKKCPYCELIENHKEDNLLIVDPELAKLWHPTKNGLYTPEMFSTNSIKRIWWTCSEEHLWDAPINSKTNKKKGCPKCSNK